MINLKIVNSFLLFSNVLAEFDLTLQDYTCCVTANLTTKHIWQTGTTTCGMVHLQTAQERGEHQL